LHKATEEVWKLYKEINPIIFEFDKDTSYTYEEVTEIRGMLHDVENIIEEMSMDDIISNVFLLQAKDWESLDIVREEYQINHQKMKIENLLI
jgi:hypothetical protein